MVSLKSWMCLMLVAALIGCAHPRYEESEKGRPQGGSQQESGDNPADGEGDNPFGSCDLEFTQSSLCASMSWERKPTEEEPGSFVLEFHGDRDPSQFVELINTLAVVLWMPDMAHGSTPVTVERLGMGQYRVSKVFFIMRGDWEIRIQLKSGQNVLDQVVLPYRF